MDRAKRRRHVQGPERLTLANELRTAYEQGSSIPTLSAFYGFSYGKVHKLLGESGVTMRPVGRPTGRVEPVSS